MQESKHGHDKIFCAHGNYPDSCPICLERSAAEAAIETHATSPREFRINAVVDEIIFLERQSGRDITKADLSLAETVSNEEKQRTTFVFRLNKQKALEYFQQPTFYHFMNEPFHRPPRYEIDRVYCDSDNPDDIANAETIYKYVNSAWKKA